MAPWLNWIEQPPPKGQVTGSNPVGVTKKLNKVWRFVRVLQKRLRKCPVDFPANRALQTGFLYKTCTSYGPVQPT